MSNVFQERLIVLSTDSAGECHCKSLSYLLVKAVFAGVAILAFVEVANTDIADVFVAKHALVQPACSKRTILKVKAALQGVGA